MSGYEDEREADAGLARPHSFRNDRAPWLEVVWGSLPDEVAAVEEIGPSDTARAGESLQRTVREVYLSLRGQLARSQLPQALLYDQSQHASRTAKKLSGGADLLELV
jgi:hypothetical protein